ncbi:MAG: lytic transglycosylase domain-containing protein [Anaerolineae bacterium]
MNLLVAAPALLQLQSLFLRQAIATLTATIRSGSTLSVSGPGDFDAIILDTCARYGVDPALVKGLIKAESGFNPSAVSPVGAKGLMQLMDSTATSLGVTDAFDPRQNIEAGVRLLSTLLARYGNEALALAAYNAGPGAVDRCGGIPQIVETQAYVPRVLSYRQQYAGSIVWEA